jgi:hypothetical protein
MGDMRYAMWDENPGRSGFKPRKTGGKRQFPILQYSITL